MTPIPERSARWTLRRLMGLLRIGTPTLYLSRSLEERAPQQRRCEAYKGPFLRSSRACRGQYQMHRETRRFVLYQEHCQLTRCDRRRSLIRHYSCNAVTRGGRIHSGRGGIDYQTRADRDRQQRSPGYSAEPP